MTILLIVEKIVVCIPLSRSGREAARAKGMTEIARETGLSREQLYRSFSEKGNPRLKTMLAVMKSLGVDLVVRPHAS